jgi:hypothetical protein
MGRYFVWVLMLISIRVNAQSPVRVTTDSVKITGAEIVIRNATKDVQGYLFNTDYGKTDFKKSGRVIQFTVGYTGFPAAGDSVYTSSDLVKKNIKIWRYGLLQAINNGIVIDTLAGKIIFRPVLVQSERIYIEALNSIDLSL